MSEEKQKKYTGYGYHGGGRPRKDVEARRQTISISGTPTEIETLKKLAAAAGVNVSRFVIDNLVNDNYIQKLISGKLKINDIPPEKIIDFTK